MTTEATGTSFMGGRASTERARHAARRPARSLSADHKLALVAGREQSRVVRRYLEALNASRSERRSGSPEAMATRIEAIDAQLAAAEPAVKIRLIQERMDLYAQLKALGDRGRLAELEQAFVAAAAAYSERKGISYEAWQQVGVDAAVLQQAGLAPSR